MCVHVRIDGLDTLTQSTRQAETPWALSAIMLRVSVSDFQEYCLRSFVQTFGYRHHAFNSVYCPKDLPASWGPLICLALTQQRLESIDHDGAIVHCHL